MGENRRQGAMVDGSENERERKVDEKMIKITTKGRRKNGRPESTPNEEIQKNYNREVQVGLFGAKEGGVMLR